MKAQYYCWSWNDENGVPFYVGKAKRGSHGHCRKRAHDYPPRPPVEQRKILSWHDDEDDALRELQRLEEKWKSAISSPGLGTLLNPLNVNLRQLQRTDRPSGDKCQQSVPVTAYNLKGEVIGEYHSMGDAARDLNLTREAVTRMCNDRQFHTNGICVRRQNQQFEPDQRLIRLHKKLIGVDETGQRMVFDTMADAAEYATGERSRGNDVKRSLKSPNTNKSRCMGWAFFYEDEEPDNYNTVTYAKRGRTKNV